MTYRQKYMKETKDINVTVFNMIANKNEAKTMAKPISYDCRCKFKSNQKQNNKTFQCECEKYRSCKKDYNQNTNTLIFENSKYLKSIGDTSVIACDEIISVIDVISIKMTNTIATDLSINFNSKKVKYEIDFYILHIVLLVIILLLTATIICYHYAKNVLKKMH